jgi:hypothetical protein
MPSSTTITPPLARIWRARCSCRGKATKRSASRAKRSIARRASTVLTDWATRSSARRARSRYIDQLTILADGIARDMWQSIARGYREILSAWDEGRAPIVADAALPGYHQDTFATIHPVLMTGAVRARAMGAPVWSTPEILRIDGLRRDDAGDVDAAHALFGRAIDLAREQGALAWELRAATSLARSLAWRGRNRAAHDALAPVHGRLTQGFATRDAMAAAALLRDL